MPLSPVLLALALLAPVPPPSAPQPPDAAPAEEVRDQVSAYLGAIHEPVSPEAFRALGPGVVDALADFARTDPLPIRRLRALDALAALGGTTAEEVHREVVASSTAPTAVRRGAVRGLARLAGPSGAPAALGPVLERDRDPAVRAAAAEALARTAPREGCAKVRARVRVEADATRFRRALAECDRSGQAGPAGK